MPAILPAGPLSTLKLANGTPIPYYVIPFDEDGRCIGPQTRRHLIERAAEYTDIFVFSHGWNNDWKTATERYDSFIDGFMKMRTNENISVPDNYKPLLVGIFWPSAVLVRREEQAPTMASMGKKDATDCDSIADIAREIQPEDRERFYELMQSNDLNNNEALELARIMLPFYKSSRDELGDEPRDASDLVAVWKALGDQENDTYVVGDVGTAQDEDEVPGNGVQSASAIQKVRDMARNAIRTTTVWVMKDRAGVVGEKGVRPLIDDLLNVTDSTQARMHLLGHSYGAKVMLSALSTTPDLPRCVHSLLLLQPAVSHLCFAEALPQSQANTDHPDLYPPPMQQPQEEQVPGGCWIVLDRVVRPILVTYSNQDSELRNLYHVAMMRAKDVGEIKTAGDDKPPNRFAALGGYGPRHSGEELIDILLPPNKYSFQTGKKIYGLRGHATIRSHGDISNLSTWWALHQLVSV